MYNFKSLLLSFLNNENYINIISMLVVAFTSYRVAIYNASRPNKLKIKQMQLDYIYLPMYRVLENLSYPLGKRKAMEISKKLNSVLNSHYELAFPQLHKLNHELQQALINNLDYDCIIRIIYHQISVDYELLKKHWDILLKTSQTSLLG